MNLETITTDRSIISGFDTDYLFKLIKSGNSFPDNFLLDVFDKYITKDSVCVDIGANIGYVSVELAKRSKFVHSFEPQSIIYQVLERNLAQNNCFNTKTYQSACHSKSCWMDFGKCQNGWLGTQNPKNTESITSFGALSFEVSDSGSIFAARLDDFIETEVNFIKIDAQGADIDCIIGTEKLIAKYHPVIVFEYEEEFSTENYGRNFSDLDKFIARYNYNRKQLFEQNWLFY